MPCRHGRASEGALSLSVVTGPLEMLMKLLHCFLGSTQRHMAVWATLEIMDRSGTANRHRPENLLQMSIFLSQRTRKRVAAMDFLCACILPQNAYVETCSPLQWYLGEGPLEGD